MQSNEFTFPPIDLISTISVLDPCATPLSTKISPTANVLEDTVVVNVNSTTSLLVTVYEIG